MPEIFPGPFYSYYDARSPTSVCGAIDRIAEYIVTNGPYDGVIAVSEGGAAALSALIAHDLEIKCMLLFMPMPPFDVLG